MACRSVTQSMSRLPVRRKIQRVSRTKPRHRGEVGRGNTWLREPTSRLDVNSLHNVYSPARPQSVPHFAVFRGEGSSWRADAARALASHTDQGTSRRTVPVKYRKTSLARARAVCQLPQAKAPNLPSLARTITSPGSRVLASSDDSSVTVTDSAITTDSLSRSCTASAML